MGKFDKLTVKLTFQWFESVKELQIFKDTFRQENNERLIEFEQK